LGTGVRDKGVEQGAGIRADSWVVEQGEEFETGTMVKSRDKGLEQGAEARAGTRLLRRDTSPEASNMMETVAEGQVPSPPLCMMPRVGKPLAARSATRAAPATSSPAALISSGGCLSLQPNEYPNNIRHLIFIRRMFQTGAASGAISN
jgi:hypothetical protein